MGPLIAEVGSILASMVAASSLGVAIKAWFASRSRKPRTTVIIEPDGKTIELALDNAHDSDELQRIVATLMEDSDARIEASDASDDGRPEAQPPMAT